MKELRAYIIFCLLLSYQTDCKLSSRPTQKRERKFVLFRHKTQPCPTYCPEFVTSTHWFLFISSTYLTFLQTKKWNLDQMKNENVYSEEFSVVFIKLVSWTHERNWTVTSSFTEIVKLTCCLYVMCSTDRIVIYITWISNIVFSCLNREFIFLREGGTKSH